MHIKNCLNSEHCLTTNQKFCSQCGQEVVIHKFALKHFFHEVFHEFTNADKGMFYLLKELALKAGVVAREHIEGKRKKYFNPFTNFYY